MVYFHIFLNVGSVGWSFNQVDSAFGFLRNLHFMTCGWNLPFCTYIGFFCAGIFIEFVLLFYGHQDYWIMDIFSWSHLFIPTTVMAVSLNIITLKLKSSTTEFARKTVMTVAVLNSFLILQLHQESHLHS